MDSKLKRCCILFNAFTYRTFIMGLIVGYITLIVYSGLAVRVHDHLSGEDRCNMSPKLFGGFFVGIYITVTTQILLLLDLKYQNTDDVARNNDEINERNEINKIKKSIIYSAGISCVVINGIFSAHTIFSNCFLKQYSDNNVFVYTVCCITFVLCILINIVIFVGSMFDPKECEILGEYLINLHGFGVITCSIIFYIYSGIAVNQYIKLYHEYKNNNCDRNEQHYEQDLCNKCILPASLGLFVALILISLAPLCYTSISLLLWLSLPTLIKIFSLRPNISEIINQEENFFTELLAITCISLFDGLYITLIIIFTNKTLLSECFVHITKQNTLIIGIIYAINIIGWLAPVPIIMVNIGWLIKFVTNICVGSYLFVMRDDYGNEIQQTSNV